MLRLERNSVMQGLKLGTLNLKDGALGSALTFTCTWFGCSYSGTFSGFFLHGRGSHMLVSLLLKLGWFHCNVHWGWTICLRFELHGGGSQLHSGTCPQLNPLPPNGTITSSIVLRSLWGLFHSTFIALHPRKLLSLLSSH
jgi:hypothetical protein